jgi:NAD(P)-dependent dehydrogenase (short-subunit alcohol dehydrogenase family)
MPAKTCVITGASRGIGLATALRFVRANYGVVAVARGAADLEAAADRIIAGGGECQTVATNIGTPAGARQAIEAALTHFGRIDVLVNNAGAAPLAPIEQMTDEDFTRAVAANVGGVFHTTRAVWPHLRTQEGGTVVNISSMASADPFPGFAVYGACKAWVNLFTKATADEGRRYGIRVFAVAPGAVETQTLRANFPKLPKQQTLDPDDVAGLIETVCDDRLNYVSGQTIFIRK